MRLRWILLFVLAVAAGALWWQGRGAGLPDGSFVILPLEGEIVDSPGSPLAERLLGRETRPLASLVSELYKAERDPRVAGVVLRIRALDLGWAKAQEIRDSLARLRAAGKRTVAHLELERYGANVEYYVASAADAIYVAPGTRNPFVGLAAEYLFFGGLFEKLGVDVEYERIGRYKSAAEVYAEREMSEPNREMSESLLDDVSARFVGDIAEGRGLTPRRVQEIIDAGPMRPEQLQEAGLIDAVAFFDAALEAEGSPERVEAEDYARVSASEVGHDPVATLALIYGTGPVVTGRGAVGPGGGRVLASDTLVEAFEAAAKSEDVRAIVFRIDSPGGSALASDLIWNAARAAREAGKPVVASFSDVAASGGYYVATGADRIVAQPGTLTGSIGVFVLRPALAGLLEKLDIGYASLTRGAHADLLLGAQPLSPGARARIREDVESVYRLFVSRVSEGRELDPAAVDAVGRGRVFTGAQAHEAGLVDVLGGLRDALREAKVLAGLDPDADVVLEVYPPPKPLLVQLREALGTSVATGVGAVLDAQLPRGAEAAVELLRALPVGAPVLVPPVLPEIH